MYYRYKIWFSLKLKDRLRIKYIQFLCKDLFNGHTF